MARVFAHRMGNYCIKDGYEHRTSNETLEQTPGDYWDAKRVRQSRHFQWSVYQMAADVIRTEHLQTVLDVGCGTALKLMELIAPMAKTVGVDQASAVEEARRLHPQGQFVGADLEKQGPQPPNETFDLILCVDVIEHMLDPDCLLSYVRDHSRDDSVLLISTPQRDMLRGPNNMKSPKRAHVREWNDAEFGAYLTSHGFEVLEQALVPAIRVAWSWSMMRERWRMLRKGIPMKHCQVAQCRRQG